MTEGEIQELAKRSIRFVQVTMTMVVVLVLLMAYAAINPDFFSLQSKGVAEIELPTEVDRDLIEDGIHVRTGLIEAEGVFLVANNCTNCHSAKLVTQNRMSAERWDETIKWMQETQGLWDLGESQEIIVNYLVTNYPPAKSGGRRANLTDIEWYESEN